MTNQAPARNTENEWLALVKAGDLAAFEKILSLYEKRIFNYLYRLTGRRLDAEDLTQETFLKLYKSRKNIDLDKSFKSWLYKIAANTAYDWFRKKNREAELITAAPDEAESAVETIDDLEPYYRIDTAQELEMALEKIKPIHKSVLLLYYKNELTYQEISDSLGLPLNTIKTHLRRAKLELKNYLIE